MRAATFSSTLRAVLLQQNLPGASRCRPPELLQGTLSPVDASASAPVCRLGYCGYS